MQRPSLMRLVAPLQASRLFARPSTGSPAPWRSTAAAIAALAVLAGGSLPAAAQQGDVRTLLDRLDRLERDMATMQQQVYTGRPPAPGQAPSLPAGAESTALGTLQVRVSQLEEEMQKLTGQVEEANYALSQLRSRVERMSSDVDFRLGELEKGRPGGAAPAAAGTGPAATGAAAAAAAGATPAPDVVGQPGPGAPPRNLGTLSAGSDPARPGAAGPVATPGAPGTATQPRTQTAIAPSAGNVQLPPGTAREQYDYAFDLMTKTDYAGAEAAFREFLSKHKDDPLAANAQYWMAETYYVRGNFNEAAQQFLTGYEKYPKGSKAPDSLMKLGFSLVALNDNQKACAVFARFEKEFPAAGGALKSRVVDGKRRAKCPGA